MENKVTNEKTKEIITEKVKKVREEIMQDFDLAFNKMCIAEKKLSKSLSDEQRTLYDDFRLRREIFYDIANEIFIKKF